MKIDEIFTQKKKKIQRKNNTRYKGAERIKAQVNIMKLNGNIGAQSRTLEEKICPVAWGCRIHQLHLCGGVEPPPMIVADITRNNLM